MIIHPVPNQKYVDGIETHDLERLEHQTQTPFPECHSPADYLPCTVTRVLSSGLVANSILPALFHRLSHTLGIFFPVILVQIGGFDVGR